ncbi:MAG: biosynthetic-type acetolactate synthase large subunit [Solirubrobacteraceae bacterium]|nr:biosynthetic-type acetolactate synthase large subunit [Solirubrobacteraceae bacterium]
MRNADALIRAIEAHGVDTVFGIPGGAALPLYDALATSGIRHVLCRHEAAAGHAAEGWARATGRPGVAIATSGPGAVNLLTAVADAWMDSVPVVFLCGQVATHLRGTMAFQETDVTTMSIPVVKHSACAGHGDDLAAAFHSAYELAGSGRPGPVLLEIPVDVAKAQAPPHGIVDYRPPRPLMPPAPDATRIAEAGNVLAGAQRPVILAGGGVVRAGAHRDLRGLAEALDAPYVTTLHGQELGGGRGWLGMAGVYGTQAANWALHRADVILAIGARFDDRLTGNLDGFAAGAQVIHVDFDRRELGKLVRPDVAICADAGLAIEAIREAVATSSPKPARAAWWQEIDDQRRDHPVRPPAQHEGEAALDALAAALPADAIVTTDVGLHQMWAAHRLDLGAGRGWITSGGAGTMGFGVPAALGAKAAAPGREVVCVTGDGSLLMHLQELVTARAERLPIKVVLLDNACLGMVRAQQDRFLGGAFAADLGDGPDWALLARACGIQVATTVEELLATDGPALLHVPIPEAAEVLPMVAPGATTQAMLV